MRLFPAASAVTLLLNTVLFNTVLLATGILPTTAHARGFDKLEAAPESVALSGVVSVDLLASPDGDNTAYIWGTLTDGADAAAADADPAADAVQPCLVALRTGSMVSNISGEQADKLGLKKKTVKVKGGSYDLVTIPDLQLGDATLHDVPAVVPDPMDGSGCMQLSLPATGLAWAVMPSTGKVLLAPAAQGAELTAKVGGTAIATTIVASHRIQYGKDKFDLPTAPAVVDATVGGQAVQLTVGLGLDTTISTDVGLEGLTRSHGDIDSVWSPVAVAGADLGSTWFRQESKWHSLSEGRDEAIKLGGMGADILAAFDIASDAAGTLALNLAKKQIRVDPRATLLAQAQANLDKCLSPDEAPTGDDADQPAGERCAGDYSSLASQALMAGDLDASLTARTALADASPGTCDSWSSLGELQLAMGKTDGAVASFQKASAQYHAWWDMDGYARDDAEDAWSDLEEDQQKVAEVQPQAASCQTADGMLALSLLANGDSDQMVALANSRTDLDPGLPAVYGAWLIMQDDVEAAHGPWRMVEHLTLGPALMAKAGLGRLFAQQGDWESAQLNYQTALNIDADDATVTAMWIDDMTARLGADVALGEARKWSAQRPDSLAALFGVARAASLGGKDTLFLTKFADAIFVAHMQQAPLNATGWATWSRYLTATERVGRGAKLAKQAIAMDATVANGWLAQAEAQQAEGQTHNAKTSLLRAAQIGGEHPGYTLLLQTAR